MHAENDDEGEHAEPERASAPNRRLLSLPADLLTIVSLAIRGGGRASKETRLRQEAATARRCGRWSASSVRAVLLVLADLCQQGWQVRCKQGAIWATPPEASSAGEDLSALKARLRAPLLAARAVQLADPAVRGFLREMERPRLVNGRLVSVTDVIDDGRALAAELRNALARPAVERAAALRAVVHPAVELVTPNTRCPVTGLRLTDIWRYFRHTWSLEYRPTPGRSMLLLVRNAARRDAPVIGIASLANAIPQLRVRDAWIGWTVEETLHRVTTDPASWPEQREAILRTLAEARAQIRSDDLLRSVGRAHGERLEAKLLALAEDADARRREQLRRRQRRLERGLAVRSLKERPKTDDGSVDWRAASEAPLFVRKRAKTLADVLFAARILGEASASGPEFVQALGSHAVVRALGIGLRELRKVGLASRLLEVNVCGAVPPYRDLIGGKLVALAVASAEVQEFYRTRYEAHPSEIASKMAGRELVRAPEVCVLTTTSLYGVAAAQYNRLKVTVPVRDRQPEVRWRELGLTEGYGTVHLGQATVEALRAISVERRGSRNVNNVFGEGNSPRLRQVREGLEALGIETRAVLQHSAARIVYGLDLFDGARRALLLNSSGDAALPPLSAIAEAWRARWLARRIENPEVLARVERDGPNTVLLELGSSPRPRGRRPTAATSAQLELFRAGV